MSRLTRLCLQHPALAMALLVATTLLLAAGLPRLRTEVGYRAFLGAEHPSVLRFDAFLERFGGGLPMAAVWSCSDTRWCESVFDPQALEMAARISAGLQDNDAVLRIASPATTALAVPGAFGPMPRLLFENGAAAADLAMLRERALADPGWVGQLISADGRTGAVVVELASSSGDVAVSVYNALDAALAPYEAQGVHFARVGGPVEFVVAGGELQDAIARLIPLMLLIVGVVLVVLLRSLLSAAAVLLCVGGAVVWTQGLLGWLSEFGWMQNTLTQPLAPLILVIGVCDGIHLVSRFGSDATSEALGHRAGRRRALEQVARDLGPPCFMTSVTTAAGFLSFSFAELESFVHFGALAAFGVMAALLLTFTLLPLVLAALPAPRGGTQRASGAWQRGLLALLRLPERRPRSVVALALALGAVAAIGFAELRVNASFEELYGRDSAVVRWVRSVGAKLRKPDTLEVELALPEGTRLAEPGTLAVVEEVATALAGIDGLGAARSVVGALSFTHRLIRADDPRFERPADTAEENEALLAALAVLDPSESVLSRWVDPSERFVRISVDSSKLPQREMQRLMGEVDAAFEDILPPGWHAQTTGPLAIVHEMIDAIRATQLESFATAALAVWLLVALFLRSAGRALLAMVPTVLPVLWTLGAMGALDLPLDVGSAMVAAVVLGIAVDNGIHLLEQYRRRRQQGVLRPQAIREAVLHVGRALVATSVSLSLGFAALTLSPWQSVASFGLVSAIAILAALVAVLVVLPALVLSYGASETSSSPSARNST